MSAVRGGHGPFRCQRPSPRGETIMAHDPERRAAVQDALRAAGLDGLVCALPANVLLLTGYWPVVGSGVVVVARDGPVVALVPEDERELAEAGGADEVHTFRPF